MSEQLDVLKHVAERLEKAHIAYMISGSIALSYFAQPRLTRDIDVVVELNRQNIEQLISAFREDYYIDDTAVKEALEHNGMFNIIHLSSMMKVDFIARKNTPYRQTEFERRQKVVIDDSTLWFVTPEDLILSKLVWASESRSELQLNDVRNLIRDVPSLDWTYLQHWADELSIADLLQEVR